MRIGGGNHTGSFSGNFTFVNNHNFASTCNFTSGFIFGAGKFDINFPLSGVSFTILQNAVLTFNAPIDLHSIVLPSKSSLVFNSGNNYIDILQLQVFLILSRN